jgi:dihydroorotase
MVFDPEEAWIVESPFGSKSRNSAFLGRTLRGRVVHTVLRGELTVTDGKATR